MIKEYLLAIFFIALLAYSVLSFAECRPVTIITPEGETILVMLCDD